MAPLIILPAVARMVGRRLQPNYQLCRRAERQLHTAATRRRPLPADQAAPVGICVYRYPFSTSAFGSPLSGEDAPSGKLQPPDHFNDKERHIFDKLAYQLEPSRLEVCVYVVLCQKSVYYFTVTLTQTSLRECLLSMYFAFSLMSIPLIMQSFF